jgi:hypothetical protein
VCSSGRCVSIISIFFLGSPSEAINRRSSTDHPGRPPEMFNNCVKVLDTENRKTIEDENGEILKTPQNRR